MPEGLSPSEVGKGIAEHREQQGPDSDSDEDKCSARMLAIVEASLLAVVALLAAYSGFASAKWATESSLRVLR